LRRNEPELDRPYKLPFGLLTGFAALILSVGLILLYMPGSPSALVWPQEWGIILFWSILGAIFYFFARLGKTR
jgi:APA family basic amino acid/polyamine antiporter